MAGRILIALLLMVCALKMSTAYPSPEQYSQELNNLLETYMQSEMSDDATMDEIEDDEIAEVNYKVKDGVRALTLCVQDRVLKVYRGAGPKNTLVASLKLPSASRGVDSTTPIVYDNIKNKKVAFDPFFMEDGGNIVGSVYYFDLQKLFPYSVKINRGDPCTLFVSETDHPRIDVRWTVGADGVGNNIGKKIFGQQDYTFWIAFNQMNYILPTGANFGWEAQIVCVFQ